VKMAEDQDLASINRRLKLLENDVEGERTVF